MFGALLGGGFWSAICLRHRAQQELSTFLALPRSKQTGAQLLQQGLDSACWHGMQDSMNWSIPCGTIELKLCTTKRIEVHAWVVLSMTQLSPGVSCVQA